MIHAKAYKTFIYTALPCEAKPLLEHFNLKKDATVRPFAVYFNDEICLTVTGLGKIAMAAGIAYTQALFASVEHPVMLNVGVAGHKHHSLGAMFLIDKIIDVDSQRNYYPSLIFTPPCLTGSIQTSSRPQLNYDDLYLCDMEASAFYETAMHFSSSEVIICLKVISDNQSSTVENVQAKQVVAFIAANLATVESILSHATALAEQISIPENRDFDQLTAHYHFTVNERIQLKNQLSRWNVITDRMPLELDETGLKNANDVLRRLNLNINACDFYL